MQTQSRSRQAGLTLVEGAAVLGIVAVLLGSGVPALDSIQSTYALDAAAAQLRTDINYGRGSAIALRQTIRLHFRSDASGSCYVLHTGGASSCTCSTSAPASCSAGSFVLRSQSFGANQPVRLSSNSSSMAFDDSLGTVTPTGTIGVEHNKSGKKLNVVINVMGRTRTCVASGSMGNHPSC